MEHIRHRESGDTGVEDEEEGREWWEEVWTEERQRVYKVVHGTKESQKRHRQRRWKSQDIPIVEV